MYRPGGICWLFHLELADLKNPKVCLKDSRKQKKDSVENNVFSVMYGNG